MKITRLLSAAMLFLLPGAIAIAYAQEHGEAKPAEHEQQAKPAKQQAKPAQHKQAEHKTAAKPAEHQQAEHKTAAKPAEHQQAEHKTAAKPAEHQQAQHKTAAKPERAARTTQAKPGGHPEQASRGGHAAGGHGSIPEARYNASFGSGHTFHVNRSQFANGSGRFQYGGYWFNAANPWPVGWLYTDPVYVAYLNGGYFLCDPIHPGVFLSINVTL